MDFSVLVQRTKLGPRNFPLSGLVELEPEWQDEVIELITQPPANQVLKVSAYTPSAVELMPIASVERPPIPLSA